MQALRILHLTLSQIAFRFALNTCGRPAASRGSAWKNVAGKYRAAFAFVGTPADIATTNVSKAQLAVPIQWLRGDLFARLRTRSYLCLEMYSLRVGNNSFNIEVLMSNRRLMTRFRSCRRPARRAYSFP
jgi:hypothetical protein